MKFASDYSKMCNVVLTTEQSIKDLNLLDLRGRVYVPLDIVHLLFNRLEREQPSVAFTLVSACSDFGLEYQKENPLWLDMQKWLQMMSVPQDLGQRPLILAPRGDIENCKVSDRFSVKMNSWTRSTFDRIPSQVLVWYCVNANIAYQDRLKSIPFGLPDWARNIDFGKFQNRTKQPKIYVNFQLNNATRASLRKNLKFHPNFFVRENELPYEEFLEEMSQYQFVLCPRGNGADQYRMIEATYCKSLPICLNEIWTKSYDKFPVIKINSWADLNNPIEFFQEKAKMCISLIPSSINEVLS